MYYDDYSTSFLSMMKPAYNVSANYTANIGGAGMAGGSVNNTNVMNMGYMSPMMNVGVGQFGADQLVKGDSARNNYYTRPIAVHKKKNDGPMILGIAATALSLAALLMALRKGRGVRSPRAASPTPVQPTPVQPRPVQPTPVQPTPVQPRPVQPRPVQPTPVQPTPVQPRLVQPTPVQPTPVQPTPVQPTPVQPTPVQPTPVQPSPLSGRNTIDPNSLPVVINNNLKPIKNYLPQNNNLVGQLPAQKSQLLLTNGSSMNVNLPAVVNQNASNGNNVKGLLPQYTQRQQEKMAAAKAKLDAAMNAPSSGQVHVTPYNQSQVMSAGEVATLQGKMTPEARAAYNKILGKQFSPGLEREAARADARAAFISPRRNAEEKLFAVAPHLANNGSVAHTTHTVESLQKGYSLGSNAKGADKLAALLAQLQA